MLNDFEFWPACISMLTMEQGSYWQVCVKFSDFSRTSEDFPNVFKD